MRFWIYKKQQHYHLDLDVGLDSLDRDFCFRFWEQRSDETDELQKTEDAWEEMWIWI